MINNKQSTIQALKDLLQKTRFEDKELDEKFQKQYQLIESQERHIKDQV